MANILIKHGLKILKVIGLLMASFFVVSLVWAAYKSISTSIPIILNPEEFSLSVQVNQSLLNEEINIWSTELDGELTNKTSDLWAKVSFDFWAKDSDGNYLCDEGGKLLFRADVYKLESGQMAEVSTARYYTQSKEEPSFTFEFAGIVINERKYKLKDKDAVVIID